MSRYFEKYEGGLRPEFGFLSDKAVIVQAWKKAHEYIRRHNWYSETLELDASCIELESLYEEIRGIFSSLDAARKYRPDPMRMIPAPKATKPDQKWEIKDAAYLPPSSLDIRPLAHLAIRDQTIAVMFMMCLANIVENRQGRPVKYNGSPGITAVSYGNRLLCSWDLETDEEGFNANEKTEFLWGNVETYDKYYNDYQAFVSRPGDYLALNWQANSSRDYYVVSLDLSKCYDRVRHEVLFEKIFGECQVAKVDPKFHEAIRSAFSWRWDEQDEALTSAYQKVLDPASTDWKYGRDGIPQGLVAGGFLANVYLLAFDDSMRSLVERRETLKVSGMEVVVHDYCRYVDDMRLVISCAKSSDVVAADFATQIARGIQTILDVTAPGQRINEKKVGIEVYNGKGTKSYIEEQVDDITSIVSGPVDEMKAWDLLRKNKALWASASEDSKADSVIVGDVVIPGSLTKIKDETIERFVVNNWRRVYKSLRPRLTHFKEIKQGEHDVGDSEYSIEALERTTDRFCDQVFVRWLKDPSKIRILRLAFDMRPNANKLQVVLTLSKELLKRNDEAAKYGFYILAEMFRAAAVETGFDLQDEDQISALKDYRGLLVKEAEHLISSNPILPWYLLNQLALFSLVFNLPPRIVSAIHCKTPLYQAVLAKTTSKPAEDTDDSPITIQLLLGYIAKRDSELLRPHIGRIRRIVAGNDCAERRLINSALREDDFRRLGILQKDNLPIRLARNSQHSLHDILNAPNNPFCNEVAALRLGLGLWEFLAKKRITQKRYFSPENIAVKVSNWDKLCDASDNDVTLAISEIKNASVSCGEMFVPEEWESGVFRNMAQIGRLMRSAIVGEDDYSRMFSIPLLRHIRSEGETVCRYRGARSSPLKRKYGLYSDRMALGGAHVAFSPWLTRLLSALLSWPGAWCDKEFSDLSIEEFKKVLLGRLHDLAKYNRDGSSVLLIPVDVDIEKFDYTHSGEEINIAIVQNLYPKWADLQKDMCQNSSDSRNLLSQHMSDIFKMLRANFRARKNALKKNESLNLVVFPELAVHPDDVYLIKQFARKENCMVFCGLIFPDHPINSAKKINSGIWIIPQRRVLSGRDRVNCFMLEQGKYNLTAEEKSAGILPYRPVQWLIRGRKKGKIIWTLSASICYDATDIRFLANLRDIVDCFIVSASNKDINVYDAMVTAMRYHLYGHIVVANSGEFGGSTIQAPYEAPYERVIVHSHGKEQAVVSLTTLDLKAFEKTSIRKPASDEEKEDAPKDPTRPVKTSPAGYSGRIR